VDPAIPLDRYGQVLADYLKSPGEQALYEASLVSRDLVHQGVGPEEIVALHMEALDQILDGFTPGNRRAASDMPTSFCSK
jgi:hypothetical protein